MDASDLIFLFILLSSGLGPLIAKFSKKKGTAVSKSALGAAPKGTGTVVPGQARTGSTTVQRTIGRTRTRPARAGRNVPVPDAKKAKAAPVQPAQQPDLSAVAAAAAYQQPSPSDEKLVGASRTGLHGWSPLQQAVVLREMLDRPKALRDMPRQLDGRN